MIEHDGALRTEEMSLATVLRMHGYEPKMDKRGRRVVWVVEEDAVDDYLKDLIREYLSGELRIEPRRFVREFTLVRMELYNFLDIKEPNERRPVRRFAVADDAAS